MKIKTKFAISNIIMLITPIILIGVISVFCVITFIIKFPVEDMQLRRAQMLDPIVFIRAVSTFFQDNPGAVIYFFMWVIISIFIIILSTTIVTQYLSRSVTKPIKELSEAVDKIREGQLDFDILGSDYEEIDSLCVNFNDMRTALKEADTRENVMNRERNMLLANISHDLKTPVTSIKGYIQGIRDGIANTPEKMEKYLNTIYAKTEIIEDMVNNLSTYSKLELSRLEFSFTEGDLNEFLAEVISDYKIDFERNNMKLNINLCEEKAVIRLDYEKLARVFANIINNAIKYRDGNSGELTVSDYIENDAVYIEFADKGIGIAPEERKKVFDGFYRVDTARTMNVKGSGLGLGIVRQIVEKHGGRIWIKDSEKGTTFIICLPLYRED